MLACALAGAACGDDAPVAGGSAVGGRGGGGFGGAGAASSTQGGSTAQTGGQAPLPDLFEVSGRVVDQDGVPLEGAVVLQAGGEVQLTTGPDGSFTITISSQILGKPAAAAGHVGYRSAALELTELPSAPIELKLRAANPPDNGFTYTFGEPGTGDPNHDVNTLFCGHCHTTYAADFQSSGHARAAKSPHVQDLYAGVASARSDAAACAEVGGVLRSGTVPGAPGTASPRCYVGAGVLPDLNACGAGALACDDPALPAAQAPQAFGACADCHAIGMDGDAGGRDLLEAEGVGFEDGVHCDACHHIREVLGTELPGGAGGRVVLQRPLESLQEFGGDLRQVMFGPRPDVANAFMGGSYQPQFATSALCSGCHEHDQPALVPGGVIDLAKFPSGRLPVHSTFSEWSEGPYNLPGTQCRFCHMPEVAGLFNSVDVTDETSASIVFGYARSDMRAHTFRGPISAAPAQPRLIDGAAQVEVTGVAIGATLELELRTRNVGCGHALPTGEPMRALLVLVEVSGCAESFTPIGGMTLPDLGGALAIGAVGADVDVSGAQIDWPASAGIAAPGAVVRVVRPTGSFWDYDGVGIFEGATLSPAQKGMEIAAPVGSATILDTTAGLLTLDAAISVAPGDLVYLGEPAPGDFVDGDPSRALAGSAGAAFARVLVDPAGARQVPHHRAVDIASDNRIRPLEEAITQHQLAIPPGCSMADVHVTVLYRPEPLPLARERAWDGRDWVAADQHVSLTL